MGAVRDCEVITDGFLGQPVNTVTTLAFIVGGVLIVAISGHRWVGVACIATGVGSFVFHGPMPGYAQLAHDLTLWFLVLAAVTAIVVEHRRSGAWQHVVGPLLLLGLVATVGRLGATNGPLCDPDSLLQPHGAWHVGAAIAVTWWALAARRPRARSERRPKSPQT